jgi:hypothetical protein
MNEAEEKRPSAEPETPSIGLTRNASEATPSDGITRREFVAGAAAATVAVTGMIRPTAGQAADAGAPIFRIHPAIGIARVGNLDPTLGFIIGPEIPGRKPSDGLTGAAVATYKLNGQIKPQAARFRIYQYEYDGSGRLVPTREVLAETPVRGRPFIKAITWTAHLANRKASFYEEDGPHGEIAPARPLRNPAVTDRAALESDFGPRSISGINAAPKPFTPGTAGSYPIRKIRAADGSTVIDYLGQLRTDGQGRLLLFGGKGRAASSLSPPQPLTHWSNNNYWFDDVADGPVTATVTIDDGFGQLTDVPMDPAGNAWALVAPPNFAPDLNAAVSLYDLLYDMGVRKLPIPANNGLYAPGGPLERVAQLNAAWAQWQANPRPGRLEFGSIVPDYQSEVWPIVLNAVNFVYTTGLVNFKHSTLLTDPLGDPGAAGAKARASFFKYLRAPEDAATVVTGPGTMPLLYGDNYYIGNQNFSSTFGQNGQGNPGGFVEQGPRSIPKYLRFSTLTPTQYGLLRAWSQGQFVPPPGTSRPDTAITPHGLDRANLENCIGSPFYPGIECGWQIRNPALYIEPFRLNLAATSPYLKPDGTPEGVTIKAGHFSRQQAVPWQADFNDCSKWGNLAWWPTARPDDVFLNVNDKLNERVPWARADTGWANGNSTASYDDMVANWYKFGFVLDAGFGFYTEQERNDQVA